MIISHLKASYLYRFITKDENNQVFVFTHEKTGEIFDSTDSHELAFIIGLFQTGKYHLVGVVALKNTFSTKNPSFTRVCFTPVRR